MSGFEGLSRKAALRRLADALAQAGLAESEPEARFLTLGLLGLRAIDLVTAGEVSIGPDGAARLADALRRRRAGEPVARILGQWEFWGLPFVLSPATLVPRPDTETVVEAALRAVSDRSGALRLLDLGTGSGCLLVALLSELPGAFGFGLDRSAEALATARRNARANGVSRRAAFAAGDWCDPLQGPARQGPALQGPALQGPFGLIVANPPYIASAVIPGLAEAVRDHDPIAALDGGPDGLDAYRRILDGVAQGLLGAGGVLVLEIGYDQADTVAALGRGRGFALRARDHDLAGHPRALTFGRSD